MVCVIGRQKLASSGNSSSYLFGANFFIYVTSIASHWLKQ